MAFSVETTQNDNNSIHNKLGFKGFLDIPLLDKTLCPTYNEYQKQYEATEHESKKLRRSYEESSVRHVVPHVEATEDLQSWNLSDIAFTMDEAMIRFKELFPEEKDEDCVVKCSDLGTDLGS